MMKGRIADRAMLILAALVAIGLAAVTLVSRRRGRAPGTFYPTAPGGGRPLPAGWEIMP
jgi:hypothetical protein